MDILSVGNVDRMEDLSVTDGTLQTIFLSNIDDRSQFVFWHLEVYDCFVDL